MSEYVCAKCETNDGLTYLKFANKLITWCENCNTGDAVCVETSEENDDVLHRRQRRVAKITARASF